MIRVVGQNPSVVSSALRHHAERYIPMKDAILNTLLFETHFGTDSKNHILRQSRTGPNSWSLCIDGGPVIKIRGYNDKIYFIIRDKKLQSMSGPVQARNATRWLGRNY